MKDVQLPPIKSIIMDLHFYGTELIVQLNGYTKLKSIMCFDPKIKYVPQTILNFITKQVDNIYIYIYSLENICSRNYCKMQGI